MGQGKFSKKSEGHMDRPKKKTSLNTILLRILVVLLSLILVLLIVAALALNYFFGKISRYDEQETQPTETIEEFFETDETVEGQETVDPDSVEWQEVEVVEKEIINILLIGQDARPGETRARSDTMMLVTFNKAKKTITMTSFLRDLYVQIPGYADNKLNVTYVLGGMELLNDTLEKNFGVQVDGNVEVSFDRFAEVIDLLGGVDMELREDEANYINSNSGRYELQAGMQHLDGEQALLYSRIRKLDPDGDFSRTNRQRKVINALIEKFRNTKMTTLLGMLDDLLPMLTTDMTNAEILGYAKTLLPMLPGCTVVSQRVPEDGTYYLGMIRGMSVVVADMNAARKLMVETLTE